MFSVFSDVSFCRFVKYIYIYIFVETKILTRIKFIKSKLIYEGDTHDFAY